MANPALAPKFGVLPEFRLEKLEGPPLRADDSRRDRVVQASADAPPPPKPGFPMARTHSPTRRRSELPRLRKGRPSTSILITATSVVGSVPTRVAMKYRPSVR